MQLYLILGLIFAVGALIWFVFLNTTSQKTMSVLDDPAFAPFLHFECKVECRVPQEFAAGVIEELKKREARSMTQETIGTITTVTFEVQLVKMLNYVSFLYSYTKGRASLKIEPKYPEQENNLGQMDKERLQELINKALVITMVGEIKN